MGFLNHLVRKGSNMCLPVNAGNFQLSIQGSRTHYCTPRITLDNPVDYSEFEVAMFEGEEWINPLYDSRFLPIKELFEDCWEHSENSGVGGYIPTEKVQILYEFCLNLESLPKAIETTEILNEVKADKGILTEEELKVIEDRYGFGPDATFSKVFDSHKALFAANAELSFKNQKYKQRLMEIMNAQFNTNDSVLAVIDLKSLAYKALEELK